MESDEKDQLLRLAAVREEDEFVTEKLCSVMIECSQSFRQYLFRQEERLRQLREQLPDDAYEVRSEVDRICTNLTTRLQAFAGAIGGEY